MSATVDDAVSGSVEELRAIAQNSYDRGKLTEGDRLSAAADALEAQARELAEATRLRRVAEALSVRNDDTFDELQSKLATAENRIAALEDAVRVKDEALREAIEFADQDAQALTPAGISMVDRWRAAVSPAENLCPHAPTYDAGLCCGHPDDCTFVSPPPPPLSNGEPK